MRDPCSPFPRFGLLAHAYTKFEKQRFAALCEHLAGAARHGDPLSLMLFRQAGAWLGRYIAALLPNVDKVYTLTDGRLRHVPSDRSTRAGITHWQSDPQSVIRSRGTCDVWKFGCPG